MADRVGQRLGSYHLTSLLGRGASADVYQGEHVYLNNCVAIKISHTYVDAHATEDLLNSIGGMGQVLPSHPEGTLYKELVF
jgi:hypothetical protein